MNLALLLEVIITAFALSVSHCSFMCGGFAILLGRLTSALSRSNALIFTLLYHLGRIGAYTFLGFIFGAFGAGVMKNATSKGLIFFACGVFLILFAVILQTRGRLLALLENSFLQGKILSLAYKLAKLRYIVILGILNGLLPCGVVYSFLALSFSSGSKEFASLIMLIFGLCTLPALLFYTFLSRFLSANFRRIAGVLSSVLMAVYGIYLAYKGYMLIG